MPPEKRKGRRKSILFYRVHNTRTHVLFPEKKAAWLLLHTSVLFFEMWENEKGYVSPLFGEGK